MMIRCTATNWLEVSERVSECTAATLLFFTLHSLLTRHSLVALIFIAMLKFLVWLTAVSSAVSNAVSGGVIGGVSERVSGAVGVIPYSNRHLHVMSYNSDVKQDHTRQAKAFHQSLKHLSERVSDGVRGTVKVDMIGKGIPWAPHLFFNK
jgi:hypothetical protein